MLAKFLAVLGILQIYPSGASGTAVCAFLSREPARICAVHEARSPLQLGIGRGRRDGATSRVRVIRAFQGAEQSLSPMIVLAVSFLECPFFQVSYEIPVTAATLLSATSPPISACSSRGLVN